MAAFDGWDQALSHKKKKHVAKRFVYFVLSVSAGQKLVPSISISSFNSISMQPQQQHLPSEQTDQIAFDTRLSGLYIMFGCSGGMAII